MSDILTNEELRGLFAKKQELNSELSRAKSQGAVERLYKRISDIQKQIDEDTLERREYDEARNKAANLTAAANGGAMHRGSGPSKAELRAFATPGNPTTDMWITPPKEIVMGTPDQFAGKSEARAAGDFLTTDTATIGSAYYMTSELYQNVVMGLLDASGVLEAQPTLIVTNHLRSIQVPMLTADATATIGVEGVAATDANPTGTHCDLDAHRFDGKFNVSIEMLMAAEYDLETMLSTYATRSIANKVAGMLALGNGTTEPLGLFTASAVTVGKTCASATTPSLGEFIQAAKALPKGYRKGARTVVSDALHDYLVITTDDAGEYYFKTLEGGGETFMGKPMYTEPQADQSGMSANELHAVHGDFSGYFVRTTPMFFRRSDADPLNPEFSFAIWMDAKVADARALVSLKMGA